jgi:hypothetical protein
MYEENRKLRLEQEGLFGFHSEEMNNDVRFCCE